MREEELTNGSMTDLSSERLPNFSLMKGMSGWKEVVLVSFGLVKRPRVLS